MKLARLAAVALAALALPALADPPPGHGHKHKHQDESAASEAPGHGGGFSPQDRDNIDAYFRAHPEARSELPPGLAKKGKIPPGWRKKLERGQRVPDDVWAYHTSLPPELVVKLPVPPVGTVYVRINDRVARVVEKTHEVLDVLGIPPPH